MAHHSPSEFFLDREPDAAERAALAWVVRCERGLTMAEEHELNEWMLARPQHQELFSEFGGTWTLMQRVEEAAVRTAIDDAPILPFSTPAPETHSRRGPRSRRTIWLPLATAAAIAIAAIGAWMSYRPGAVIATAVGASKELTLPDGSTVALNTDSAVSTAFEADERRVRLEKGEAFFQVAKDPARPFVVEAAGVGVRAIGTAFNVRVHPEAIEVLVTEGKVRVAPLGKQPAAGATLAELIAGERVFVPLRREAAAKPTEVAVARVAADEVQRRLAWQDGRLDFSDTPLAEMVAEFNRYNRHQLAVPDPALGAMRFGGSFRPDDRVGFVRMLRENFGILADEQEQRTILRSVVR